MTEATSGPLAEIGAMQKVAEALAGLEADATRRVLRWANDHFLAGKGASSFADDPDPVESKNQAADVGPGGFAGVEDLYDAASPTTDADKALVIGYWFQFRESLAEFDSQKVNSQLKHMGHGVTNITSAFTSLKEQKPALVMQTKKAGTSQQARKRYKLTSAGKQAVEAMLNSQG